MNLYNPNVKLFTSVLLSVQFLSTGGLKLFSRFETIDFYTPSLSANILILFYICIIIYLMFIEFQKLFHLKHYFWFVINLGIIVCSWMSLIVYVIKGKQLSRIDQLFSQTNGYIYINLQYLTYLNDFLRYMYGFCCFFGRIKCIRLFRYNSHIYLFIYLFQLFKFEQKNYLVLRLCFQLFSLLLYVYFIYYFHQQLDAHTVLGPIVLILFIFIVIFVVLSMFLTILTKKLSTNT